MTQPSFAPEWDVTQWLGTSAPANLAALRGRVVVATAFQMLCPGCVEHSLPQLQKVQALFPKSDVAVLGLHTVFEHHEAMGPKALAAFMHEYRIAFPVAVDRPGAPGDPIPSTMRTYQMQGTPTLMLIGRDGSLRRQVFGRMSDLQLGAEIMALMCEAAPNLAATTPAQTAADCGPDGCPVD